MPQQIIQAAQKEMYGDRNESAAIIRDIEDARRRTLDEQRKARKSRLDADALRRRYEDQVRRAEAARLKAHESVKAEAQNLIRKYTKRLDKTLEDLSRQQAQNLRAQKLEKQIDDTIEEMTEQLVEVAVVEEEPEGDYTFQAGDTVRIASLQQEGVLLENPERDEAMVQVGAMKVTVPVSALRPPRKRPQEAEKPEPVVSVDTGVTQAQSISPELKLIAQRVEPALENLDRYVHDAILAGLDEVRIIHGMGTGALKRAVWEYLKTHPSVESYHLAERNQGGAGATIVELKK